MVRLNVLGAVDLRDADGREYRSVLAQPKRVALLTFLAIEGGFQRRDTLLALLWPEFDDERARHSLNQGLYALRRSLGAGAVISRGAQEVGLDPERVWCDATALQQAIAEGKPAEGLELYRDDLLKGFFLEGAPEFEQWVEATRARLRDGAAKLAWAAAHAEEASGNAAGAAYWGRRAIHLCRDDEAWFREFLALLARTGQRALALREFELFEKRLRDQYDLEPDPATRRLLDEMDTMVRAQAPRKPAPAASSPETAHSFDALTPFVGRTAEVAELELLLKDPAVRLVTIAGPAGAGKTRLALHVASRAAGTLSDGVIVVPLAAVTTPDQLPSAIAAELRIERAGPSALGQVLGVLRDRQLLLVLDNMDHLVSGAAVLADLLATAPRLKLLVTSREVLNLTGEWVFPLGGMTWPADPDSAEFAGSDAARLFVEAAKRAMPSFAPGPEDRACLMEILALVDGLPLGLELAAAWARAVSLPAMVEELRSSRLALANPLRDAPQRHASLGAAFAYSWQHLGERDREACCALSVFRGGFSRGAAEHVAGAPIGILRALVDRSLVQRMRGDRYTMLEVIREYAAERLAEDPTALTAARDRHRDYFADFLYERVTALRGALADGALLEIEREADNVRNAWRSAVETVNAPALERSLEPLFIFCDVRGLYEEGAAAFSAAAGRCPESRPALLARLLARQGAFCLRMGRLNEAELLLKRAHELARAAGEVSESAFILDRLGVAGYERGDLDAAREAQEESLRLRQGTGDRHGVATSLNNLGSLAYATGAFPEARELCGRSLQLQRELGDTVGAILSLHNLGSIELMLGQPERATAHLQAALDAARTAESDALVARSLYYLGNAAHCLGRADQAAVHFHDALAAVGSDPTPLALDVLMGLAGSLRHSGSRGSAVEILSFVTAHPAAEGHRRRAASDVLSELSREISAEDFARHVARGRSARFTDLAGRAV